MKLTQQETVQIIQMQSIDEVVEVLQPMKRSGVWCAGGRKGVADQTEHRDVE